MIKFFRKIRYDLMEKNLPAGQAGKTGKPASRTGRYFKYAIGEIVLVVIGILIALYLNDLKDKNKEDSKRNYYIESIKKDLIEDQILITKMIDSVQNSINIIDGQVNRIYNKTATIDTLLKIAQNEFLTQVSAISFNDKSLKSLISTGELNLLQTNFSELLLDLDKTRSEQKEVRNTLTSMYNDRINEYQMSYPRPYDDLPKDNLVDRILWSEIDEKDFVGKFRGLLFLKRYKEREFIKDLKSSQKQTKFLIEYINNNY